VEIKQALKRGTVSGHDQTTHTLQWYRALIDWGKRIKELYTGALNSYFDFPTHYLRRLTLDLRRLTLAGANSI